ncbi:MAG: TonB-dependent siderophore receptor, partial [Pseudomonadota bacterium]|nr:TonB-dependent siderophore receptor [Pseudomonadota bacterium]
MLALAANLSSSPALAGEVSDKMVSASDAQLIIVTGQREDYRVKATRTGTRTDTEIKDIPQSISVFSESQIEDQALRSIADILNFVPGATPGQGEGNRDQITLRGNNSTADFFIDGIRDDVQYSRDLYNAERIEILKGPNAMIFGRGGGGGVINRVTKRSSLGAYNEFAAQGDSEGGVRLTGDVDQPLSGSVGLRVNGIYENGESFRRGVDLERYAINPTLGIMLGADTRADIAYEYLHDRRTTDRGVPSNFDRPLAGVRRTFFGDPDKSYAEVDVHLARFAIEHDFGDGLSVRNRTHYGEYDKFYQNIFPGDYLEASDQVRLSAYNDSTKRENLFSQTDLVWDTELAGVDQTLLLGFEIGRQETSARRITGFFQPSNSPSLIVPAANPTIDADVIFSPSATDAYNSGEADVTAVYFQNQLRLSDQFEIVAGVRFDRFALDIDNLRNGQSFSRTDELVSPRIGIIARPIRDLSLYASFSRSYLPSSGDQFSALTLTTEAIEPERFDNFEIGAKWEPVEGLLATAAIYQLDRTNSRAPSPDANTIVLTGEQRSKGIELGVQGKVSQRWQLSAGYALQDAEIRRRTETALAGRTVPLVPRHQFSLWNRYDATQRLGVGLGVIAASKSFASISNNVTLPSYARVDAALFYA